MSNHNEKYEKLAEVIKAHKEQKGALMPVLQEAQNIFGCVSEDVQKIIAEGLGVTLSEVYGVATFYENFSLEAKGKYVIKVCDGTACHVRKSMPILEKLRSELGLSETKKTTDDKIFTVETVACLGACGLAPVMMINDDVYGRLTEAEVPAIIAKYKAS